MDCKDVVIVRAGWRLCFAWGNGISAGARPAALIKFEAPREAIWGSLGLSLVFHYFLNHHSNIIKLWTADRWESWSVSPVFTPFWRLASGRPKLADSQLGKQLIIDWVEHPTWSVHNNKRLYYATNHKNYGTSCKILYRCNLFVLQKVILGTFHFQSCLLFLDCIPSLLIPDIVYPSRFRKHFHLLKYSQWIIYGHKIQIWSPGIRITIVLATWLVPPSLAGRP